MSGGAFDYKQYQLEYIADEIEQLIEINGTKRESKESWEDEFHYKYPDDIIEKFKEAIKYLKLAKIYTHRIDWLVSGDDGEQSFRERLEEDLEKI
jgi:hypothetical protein